VVGHLSAALDPDDLDPARGDQLGRRDDMVVAGIATEREDRVVLEEKELVLVKGASGARGGQGLLESPRVAIRDPAQPAGMQETGPAGRF
jgi:hypothetical protein